LYQQDEDKFPLVWEWRTDGDEYEIRNNEVIFDRRVKGVRGLCMSKDFIITLQRDRRKMIRMNLQWEGMQANALILFSCMIMMEI